MPFIQQSYSQHGQRFFYSTPTTGNIPEIQKVIVNPSAYKKTRKLNIQTIYNKPGLPFTFVLATIENNFIKLLPLPAAFAGQLANLPYNTPAPPTNGMAINTDATLTPDLNIPLDLQDGSPLYILNVADPNTACQAIFTFTED